MSAVQREFWEPGLHRRWAVCLPDTGFGKEPSCTSSVLVICGDLVRSHILNHVGRVEHASPTDSFLNYLLRSPANLWVVGIYTQTQALFVAADEALIIDAPSHLLATSS